MAFNGDDVKIARAARYTPQSSDPANPTNGDTFLSDGTSRSEGFWRYDGANWVPAEGGASLGVNYVTNPDAEGGTTDWVTYADVAATSPVDGTGGSPTAALAKTTVAGEILRGTGSFELAKDAADRQGEGSSTDVVIDNQDKDGKRIDITFDYETSANFATGDMRIFVYDIDNAVLLTDDINGDSGDIIQSTAPTSFHGSFVSTDSQNYRLIMHIASTNATAYDLFYDTVKVGPPDLLSGTFEQNYEDFTPTTQGIGTPTINIARYRQIGSSVEVLYNITAGTVTAAEMQVGLPNSWTVDNGGAADVVMVSFANGTSTSSDHIPVLATDGDAFLNFSDQNNLTPLDGDAVVPTSGVFSFRAIVPVKELSASANLAPEDVNTALVRGAGNGGEAITALTEDIVFTEVEDNRSAWDGTSFTAPKTGVYRVSGSVRLTGSASQQMLFYVDGTQTHLCGYNANATLFHSFSASIKLLAGEVLSIRFNVTATLVDDDVYHWILIQEEPEFKVFSVLALKHVATITDEKADTTAGGGFTSGSYQTRTLNTLDDTGMGVTLSSDQFTLPKGKYFISASAPAYNVDDHKIKLRNITDSTDDIMGSSESSAAADTSTNRSELEGIINIPSTKTFELQHRCQTTKATDGFGLPMSFGDVEIYSQVKIEKL